jgi:hypothetical protein
MILPIANKTLDNLDNNKRCKYLLNNCIKYLIINCKKILNCIIQSIYVKILYLFLLLIFLTNL